MKRADSLSSSFGCVGKHRYDTRDAAVFFARADGLRAYRCRFCKGWHLSSMERTGKKMGVSRRAA